MVKKKASKKVVNKEISKIPEKEIVSDISYIDWKIPAAFVAGILVTVLYFNLPVITSNTAIDTIVQTVPTLFILNDATCVLCDDSWVEPRVTQDFNVTIQNIDSNSAQGQQLITELGITSLPAIFVSSNFENVSAFENYTTYGWVQKTGDYYVLLTQGIKDLTKEESSTPKVDLFVMSQCPYGTPAQTNMINLKKTVPDFELNFHYIVDVQSKSEMDLSVSQLKTQYDAICADAATATQYGLECTDAEWAQYDPALKCELKSNNNYYCSLHGPAELELDMIQICAMNLSANWGEFILSHISSNFNTTKAAEIAGIDYTTLMDCVNSSLGLELLDANIALTNELGIGSSPTYIFDNVFTNPGQDPSTVLCTLHSTLAGCESIDKLELATSTGSC
ncbi:MAG: hypothetical protein PHN56_03125 [Candidatus Nanoarchaeia archaeon]|nr:hypothetical protein [Candidatus Nanoarchaeia archaeon]